MSLALVELKLGYDDFLALTPYDLAYLYEKRRTKEMIEVTHVRNAFFNAYLNARRDKNEKFIPLFDEIEGRESKKKKKSPEELKKEREEFFNMVQSLGGGC